MGAVSVDDAGVDVLGGGADVWGVWRPVVGGGMVRGAGGDCVGRAVSSPGEVRG
ncbi:hypothetical protein [Streptomyces ossamyceticus]|uniref:hypothetical protein n=1 Tax=Streptomyces ossamyceticus TaxID=249581 RepID=UPI0034273884